MDKTKIEQFDAKARLQGEKLMSTWEGLKDDTRPATLSDIEKSHQSLTKMISWLGGLVQRLEKNVTSLEERLYRSEQKIENHIEIYAKNNKELALLNEKLLTLGGKIDEHINNGDKSNQTLIASLDVLNQKIDRLDPEIIKAMSQTYTGLITSKNMIVGVSSVVIGISAIGAGFIWLVRHSL